MYKLLKCIILMHIYFITTNNTMSCYFATTTEGGWDWRSNYFSIDIC